MLLALCELVRAVACRHCFLAGNSAHLVRYPRRNQQNAMSILLLQIKLLSSFLSTELFHTAPGIVCIDQFTQMHAGTVPIRAQVVRSSLRNFLSTELFYIAPGICELLSPLMTFLEVPNKVSFHAAQTDSRTTRNRKHNKRLHSNFAQGLASTRTCLLYTSPSPRDLSTSRMPSSA